jgi:hypothetical protein
MLSTVEVLFSINSTISQLNIAAIMNAIAATLTVQYQYNSIDIL